MLTTLFRDFQSQEDWRISSVNQYRCRFTLPELLNNLFESLHIYYILAIDHQDNIATTDSGIMSGALFNVTYANSSFSQFQKATVISSRVLSQASLTSARLTPWNSRAKPRPFFCCSSIWG